MPLSLLGDAGVVTGEDEAAKLNRRVAQAARSLGHEPLGPGWGLLGDEMRLGEGGHSAVQGKGVHTCACVVVGD